ncbi:POTRA domain-containing protein, partial [Vibrio fortis]
TAKYQDYVEGKQQARRKLKHGDKTVVDEVVINNNSHYSDKLIENRLNLEAGQVLKTSQIETSVQNLYALDRFELITYQFDDSDGVDQLVVDVNEKEWGPNYLNFRFFLEDDFATDSQYSIGVSANFTDINQHGAE